MMLWTDVVQTVTTIIGTLLAVAGFVAVILQLKNLQQSIRVSNRATIYQLTEQLKSKLLENYTLRKYIFEDKEIDPKSEDSIQVVALADYVITYLELIATHKHEIEEENREAWVKFIRMVYWQSPVVRQLLEERRETISRVFWKIIQEDSPS